MSKFKVDDYLICLVDRPHLAPIYKGDIVRVVKAYWSGDGMAFGYLPCHPDRKRPAVDCWSGQADNFKLLNNEDLTELDKLIYNILSDIE